MVESAFSLLLLRNPVLTHALPRLLNLAQDILSSDVSSTYHSRADDEVGPISPEPAACRRDHFNIGTMILPDGVQMLD